MVHIMTTPTTNLVKLVEMFNVDRGTMCIMGHSQGNGLITSTSAMYTFVQALSLGF